MDIQRIQSEVLQAARRFALVEAHAAADGSVIVKAGLQTAVGNPYVVIVTFAGYPVQMPSVCISKPAFPPGSPHRYTNGNICYLHPKKWNPGFHDLTFVLGRTAKWLSKYEVWRRTGRWPGAQTSHEAQLDSGRPPTAPGSQPERGGGG